MALATLPYTYRYAHSSAINAGAQSVEMATSLAQEKFPYFFQGQMVCPWMTAQALRLVSRVVGSRFHIPPAMLRKIIALSDPVVTSGGGFLRFEGFSACCSAYARADLAPDAYRGVIVGEGTTNVDFNAPFRAALAQIRDGESMSLAVGREDVTLLHGEAQYVEKKVDLPFRWLKSFCEIQSFQARMVMKHQLRGVEALHFLRSIPASAPAKTVFWLMPVGKGLRLSQRPIADGIRISGIERLRLLQELASFADSLHIYGDPAADASEWVMRVGPVRVSLTLSAEVWRGFSGEGQVLRSLAQPPSPSLLEQVRGILKWQAELRASEFAANWDTAEGEVIKALDTLASRGLAGFDVCSGAYFHREMPFDMDLVESVHPRLIQARELVAKGGVQFVATSGESREAEVQGSGVVHRVRLAGGHDTCTCTWFARHQISRGPCKHVLAARIASGENEDDDHE